MSRRLFKLCVATVVAIAVVVTMVLVPTTAYAQDDRVDPAITVEMFEHDEFYFQNMRGPTNYFYVDNFGYASFQLSKHPNEYLLTGAASIVFQISQGGKWKDLSTVSLTMELHPEYAEYGVYRWPMIRLIGTDCDAKFGKDILRLDNLGIGSYRMKAVYGGDDFYLPVETSWYGFKVIANPWKTKLAASATVTVASGKTKASNLTIALAVPTATVSLKSVKGVYPTGSATFTTQIASGGKWKTLGVNTVKLSKGGAKLRLSKVANAANYRVQVKYNGDGKFKAVSSKWAAVKVAKTTGTTKRAINVYTKASNGKKMTVFKKARPVTIVGKSGRLYKVQFRLNGKATTGYVAQTFINVKR